MEDSLSFFEYLLILKQYWWVVSLDIMLGLFDVVERVRGKEMPLSRWWYVRIFICCLLLAQGFAYFDLHKDVVATHPLFVLKVDQAAIVEHPGDDPTDPNIEIVLFASLLNKGADSAAMEWKCQYSSPSMTAWMHVDHPINDAVVFAQNMKITVGPEDDLMGKARNVISRGSLKDGTLLLKLPKEKFSELTTGKAKFTLYVEDYLGKQYNTIYATSLNDRDQDLGFHNGLRVAPR